MAAQSGARLAWNAPGVPMALERHRRLSRLRDAMIGASDYVSLRDADSVRLLDPPPPSIPVVVPDTALDIARMWPPDSLREAARLAFVRRGAEVPERWLVCHVNDRYADNSATRQAAVIREICATAQAFPVLVALGPCQGDDALVRTVGAALGEPSLIVDRPDGLREIAGLLAHGVGYAGSSLHGMITALSYGRPAMVVARRRMVKFAGFLDHVGMSGRLVETWRDAAATAESLLRPLDPPAMAAIARAQSRIAVHWERLRALLSGAGTTSAAQARTGLARWMGLLRPGPNDWRAFTVVLDGMGQTGGAANEPVAELPTLLQICNICGWRDFPAGTEPCDPAGFGAVCQGCGSSARHRAFRAITGALRTIGQREGTCLTFSKDRIVARGWFLAAEDVAVNGTGRIERAVFDRAGTPADAVICVDILERAMDLREALRALLRATRPGGYALLGVRIGARRETTMDWGFPRGDRDGAYRMFGADAADIVAEALPDAAVVLASPVDPVTGIAIPAIVLAHAPADLRRLFDSSVRCRLMTFPMVAAQ
jgi:hypothetical protein